MQVSPDEYPARYDVDYPEQSNRLTTFFRIPLSIPIWILSILLPMAPPLIVSLAAHGLLDDDSSWYGAGAAFWLPLALMLLLRRKYPRWWFDFLLELNRFQARITAYLSLLTDLYPSTDEEQSVHLELDYPDAQQLNRFLPIVKWLLLIPHYVVLVVLSVIGLLGVIFAWFAILFTGRFPRFVFDYLVGVHRWGLRVTAYGFLLITDRYPPFRLGP